MNLQNEKIRLYYSILLSTKLDCQNVIYFADFNDEQQFIHSGQALWAVLADKSEVDILAVTLNTDLAKRLVTWEKVSETVIQDLVPPSRPLNRWKNAPPGGNFSPIIKHSKCLKW